MPTFDVIPDESHEHDIDPMEFVDECDDIEIEELIDYLKEQGKLPPCSCEKLEQIHSQVQITDWYSITKKLMDNQHQLTNEEETIIFNIANRLV